MASSHHMCAIQSVKSSAITLKPSVQITIRQELQSLQSMFHRKVTLTLYPDSHPALLHHTVPVLTWADGSGAEECASTFQGTAW